MKNLDFIRAVGDFRQSIDEGSRPSWLKVATITLVSKYLSEQGMNLDHSKIHSLFDAMKTIPIKSDTGATYNWEMFYSDFYNQVTIGYTDKISTKKVKIFPNGSLQIAGCANMTDCHRFIKQLQVLMKLIFDVDIPEESFKIVMINSNFTMNREIHQMNAIRTFSPECKVDFHPDRYSAVKVKYKTTNKEITVSIFGSGSIIISGAETMTEIFQTYQYIVHKIVSVPGILLGPSDHTNDFDFFMGYKCSDIYKKIKNVDVL